LTLWGNVRNVVTIPALTFAWGRHYAHCCPLHRRWLSDRLHGFGGGESFSWRKSKSASPILTAPILLGLTLYRWRIRFLTFTQSGKKAPAAWRYSPRSVAPRVGCLLGRTANEK
jgi:hypothetical protein